MNYYNARSRMIKERYQSLSIFKQCRQTIAGENHRIKIYLNISCSLYDANERLQSEMSLKHTDNGFLFGVLHRV